MNSIDIFTAVPAQDTDLPKDGELDDIIVIFPGGEPPADGEERPCASLGYNHPVCRASRDLGDASFRIWALAPGYVIDDPEFVLTPEWASEELGMDEDAYWSAFRELEEKGYIIERPDCLALVPDNTLGGLSQEDYFALCD